MMNHEFYLQVVGRFRTTVGKLRPRRVYRLGVSFPAIESCQSNSDTSAQFHESSSKTFAGYVPSSGQ